MQFYSCYMEKNWAYVWVSTQEIEAEQIKKINKTSKTAHLASMS